MTKLKAIEERLQELKDDIAICKNIMDTTDNRAVERAMDILYKLLKAAKIEVGKRT